MEGFGIRLNKQPPHINIRKKERGGIAISHTVPLTHIETEEIKAVLAEYKISNADIGFRCDPTLDEFIDVVEGGRVYIPCLYVLNKIGVFHFAACLRCAQFTDCFVYFDCRRNLDRGTRYADLNLSISGFFFVSVVLTLLCPPKKKICYIKFQTQFQSQLENG